ncbi:MAG: TonB-dependent receptor [Woeseia sp.]|nr:TonB-dependent receptor [Woeseia sp.]MBU2678319.1 TonB-dependent receptor [Gammaproteobacteria bacterium]NNE60942.1 TonB-dependent receptor [Woeseia sp.]NNL52054.1 TonB-dependent receptor [Woeseiaceae bacterium]NNL53982.1 TonB-dependent receptor [Woeseia sp.]
MAFRKHKPLVTLFGLIAIQSVAYGQIEEITVTAQKRAESLQDVPIAVTAFTGDTLETLGVTNASDLVNITPGFSLGSQAGSNRNYFLRGVGTSDVHLTAASAVGQYFDDITLTSGFHAKAALFDMERVEVLKGPQNTLYGLNTTGGAVNYISRKPEIGGGTQGNASVKVGNYNRIEAELAVGFEVTDTLAARVALQSINDDGAFKSISNGQRYGDDDTKAGRLTLLWQPTDEASVTFNVHALKSDNNSTSIRAIGTRSPDGSGGLCADVPRGVIDFESNTNCLSRDGGGTGELASDPSTGDWELSAQDIGFEDLDTRGAYLKIDYDLPWATLSSITSWDNLEFRNANDNDGGDTLGLQSYQQDDRDTFQQEFRLISTSDGGFRWIAGVYFLDDDAQSYTGLRGARGAFRNGLQIPNIQLDNTKENLGLYFQGEYDFTDTLTLTAGVRWSDEEITGNYLPSSPSVAGAPTSNLYFREEVTALVAAQNPGTAEYDSNGYEIARQITQKLTNEDVGYTVKLDWAATDSSLLYLSNSKGFKGSALDIRPVYALVPVANVVSSLEETRLEPESLDVWEIGYKGTFWDSKVQFDAAAFIYKYEDLQQFVTARGIPILDNAPESEIKGLDASIKYAGEQGLFLQAGISLLDTEVTEVGDSTFVDGAELANSPDVSFNLLASQEFDFESGNWLTLTANVSHTGDQVKVTATSGNSQVVDQLSVDAYTLLSANASYRFGEDQKYNLSVYGSNLTDEHYCDAVLINDGDTILGNTTSAGGSIHMNALCRVSNASTRTYGISFSVDF